MTFRRRLLIAMSLIVFLTVGAVAIVVLLRTNSAFARADAERTDALVAQFRREFSRRGEDVTQLVQVIASGDSVQRMAADLAHGGDPSVYLTEARSIAESHQLDLLDIASSDGAIISSAESPARFGYKVDVPLADSKSAFLASIPVADGPTLGLVAVRAVDADGKTFYVIGGTRLDREFLSSLTLPAGMRALLYRAGDSAEIIGPDGPVQTSGKFSPLLSRLLHSDVDVTETIDWSGDAAESETFHAIPLKAENGTLLGALLIGASRRGAVELQRHIAAVALIVAAAGIFLAILFSGWVAARVTRPIEDLAHAAQEVSAGNWNAQVHPHAGDELGALAESFNAMTRQLTDQRDRLVQAERVAAWRELARRLAHELKNPLFPLQITVENLVRARDADPALFDEVFRESTSTLLGEVANLKAIIGRFSDFSKMPQPQLQSVDLQDLARQVLSLHAAQFHAEGRPQIDVHFEPDSTLGPIDADPDLLRRALSNLVLNAMDAMPGGGRLTLRTAFAGDRARLEVSDTGAGLTKEECERLFTPYYTTKQHGTGLGLAIVQSVISDHHGSIAVESEPGKGTTFRIDLPARKTSDGDIFHSAVIS